MSNLAKIIIIILLAVALLGVKSTRRRIRKSDNWGSGYFGAPRGNRPHLGIDLIYSPDEEIRAPFDLTINRVSYPYASSPYSGIAFTTTIDNIDYDGRMWYMLPDFGSIGKSFKRGQIIGVAQQINEKYPGMINHVHLQLEKLNEQPTKEDITYNSKVFTNPNRFII
jgi:hypothetical protein